MKTRKITVGKSIMALALIFFGYWSLTILHCEYLTFKYGSEYVGLEEQTKMLPEAANLKVLYRGKYYSAVYYRAEDWGDILYFSNTGNGHKLIEWETIWSKGGSADDFMWPYLR
jgi:hypothetical protein